MMNKKPVESGNVIDLFTRKPVDDTHAGKIIRLAPELDGLAMLYSNNANPNKVFSMKILCWALMKNGEVDALIPWLNQLVSAKKLNDPLNGHWQGYYDPNHHRTLFTAPHYKRTELETAAAYFHTTATNETLIIQEIMDTIGTHGVFTHDRFKTMRLIPITSWRLYNDGRVHAMLANDKNVTTTPVLTGDSCLFPAQAHPGFRYFFHYVIANKIKQGDPEAIAAFTHLLNR